MKDVIKTTKGNLKLKQYLEDLTKNHAFVSLCKKIEFESLPAKRKKLMLYMADKYGIDWEMFENIRDIMEGYSDEIIWGDRPDVCEISDRIDEIEYEKEHKIPIEKDMLRYPNYLSYPVSINLHKLASKKDVIDFIEKRWEFIEPYLDRTKLRIRKRKNQELINFIFNFWNNESIKFDIKDLKKKLDEKFSDNNLAYYEIYKIISIEKRRRFKDLKIGN